MNLPETDFTVKIGPMEYEVIYSDDISNEGSCFGSTHNNLQRIFLQKTGIKRQQQEKTFVHEVLHAFHFVNGLTYRFDSKDHPPTEEDVARENGTSLYQFISDNRWLFN